MSSYEHYKIVRKTYYEEYLRAAASAQQEFTDKITVRFLCLIYSL